MKKDKEITTMVNDFEKRIEQKPVLDKIEELINTEPVKIEGSKFNLNILRKGNFVFEGYVSGTRHLRYLGPIKSYKEVRNTPKRGDIRTHNIDLLENMIWIENNNSVYSVLHYKTTKIAEQVFCNIIGITSKELTQRVNDHKKFKQTFKNK